MKITLKFLKFFVVVMMLLCLSTLCINSSAYHEEDVSARLLSSGKTYTVNFDYENESSLNKIVLKSNGVITIDIKSIIDDYGDNVDFDLSLYKGSSSNSAMWSKNTSEVSVKKGLYSFVVPLNKDTYYLEVEPESYIGYETVFTTKVKYTFAKSTYWESEPNNSISQSDTLKLDYMYKAFSEDSYEGDFFCVQLTKNQNYTLKIDNFEELNEEYGSVEMFDSSGASVDATYNSKEKNGTVDSWDFKVSSSGKYYIEVSSGYGDADISYRIGVYNKRITASQYPTSLSYTTSTYNGKVKTPKVVVKTPSGTKLKNKTHYTVSYQSGRKNVGEYIVKITYIGKYKGSKKLTFKILPVTTELTSLASNAEAFTAKWKKQASQTTGYQLQYSTSSKFKKAKIVNIKNTKTLSKKITSLKGGQKYYVRIRTYKTVDGENIYSKWSAVKSVTAKKTVSIKLNKASATIYTGGSYTPKYTTYPAKVTVKWSTSNSAVAKVSTTGKITAVKAGAANITASFTYNKKTYKDTIKVTVKTPSLTLNKTSASIYRWASLTLKATAKPSGVKVNWKTSNSNIATVSASGVVKAENVGTANITAYFTYGGKTYSKVCKITVLYRTGQQAFYDDLYNYEFEYEDTPNSDDNSLDGIVYKLSEKELEELRNAQ